MDRGLRRTRFVCLSDTHNASPEDGAFKLPKGDVFVHAGDLTKQGTYDELKKTLDWIEKADFEVKLVVAGNHDVTLDRDFYAIYGADFHNQQPQDTDECIQLVKSCKSVTFLNHEAVDIDLTRTDGPRTSFKVFGSPYSPRHGLWAFGYESNQASALWDKIPPESDVVITHTPPKSHCDECENRGAIGCEGLRQTMWRVRPSLHICGHVHEGRGVQRVLWDLSSPEARFKELATSPWEDPNRNAKKQCLLDLSRRGREPLRNIAAADITTEDAQKPLPEATSGARGVTEVNDQEVTSPAQVRDGPTLSGGRDDQALEGRMDRKETCVVNAAIMASSWPYKAKSGSKYNKAFVIDIDLPVRHECSQDSEKASVDLDSHATGTVAID